MYIIGNQANLLLKDIAQAPKVHSVFRNAVNIGYSDEYLVTILPEPLGCGPLAITLSVENYNDLKRKIGIEGTAFDSGMLECYGEGRTEYFNLPEKLEGIDESLVGQNLELCRRQLAASDKHEGLAVMEGLKFRTALEIIYKSVRGRDYMTLAEGAFSIVGLGPGLTPTGDDFLYGMFAALFYFSRYRNYDIDWIKSALELVVPRCRYKTTIISYNMLRTCQNVEFNGYMADLLSALLCGTQQEVESSCSRVLAVGSSSGSDMVTGVIFGLQALI